QHHNLPPFPTRRSSDLTITQVCCSTRRPTRVAEKAVTSSHPVDILQYRRTPVDARARRRSGVAERVLHEKIVIDVAQQVCVPERSEEHTSELQSPDHLV